LRSIWQCAEFDAMIGRPLLKLLPVFLALSLDAGADEPEQLTAKIAWGGYFRSGVPTEIGLTLISAEGGRAAVRLVSGDTAPIDAALAVDPGTPRFISIPVTPSAEQPIRISGFLPNRRTFEAEIAASYPISGRAVAVAAEGVETNSLLESLAGTAAVISAHASDLPRMAQSYQVVDMILLGDREFAELDPEQFEALSDYLRDCGRLVFLGAEETWENLEAEAGCGGAFAIRAEHPGQGAELAGELLDRAQPSLPGIQDLRDLSAAQPPMALRTAAVLLFCYFTALSVAGLTSPRPWPLFLLPLAFSALAAALLTGKPPEMRLTGWTETSVGDDNARFVALLTVSGTGRWQGRLPAPIKFWLPKAETYPDIQLDIDRPETHGLALKTELFSYDELLFRGTIRRFHPPLTLDLDQDAVAVANPGGTTQPAGLLAWDGKLFALPSLRPGERWSAENQAPVAPDSPEAYKLRPYLNRDRMAALLIPYASRLWRGNEVPGDAEWLLIKARL
jgi:hypothetical protein